VVSQDVGRQTKIGDESTHIVIGEQVQVMAAHARLKLHVLHVIFAAACFTQSLEQ
jgi:hypothetical protein